MFASYVLKQKKLQNGPVQTKSRLNQNQDAISLEEVEDIHTNKHLSEVVMELKAGEFEESLSTMYNDVLRNVHMS